MSEWCFIESSSDDRDACVSFECGAHGVVGVMEAGTDRPRGKSENLGDLGRLVANVVAEHEDRPLVRREPAGSRDRAGLDPRRPAARPERPDRRRGSTYRFVIRLRSLPAWAMQTFVRSRWTQASNRSGSRRLGRSRQAITSASCRASSARSTSRRIRCAIARNRPPRSADQVDECRLIASLCRLDEIAIHRLSRGWRPSGAPSTCIGRSCDLERWKNVAEPLDGELRPDQELLTVPCSQSILSARWPPGRYNQDRRAETAAATSRRIRVAARALYRERGISGTTTAAIAELADVARGTILHHFGSGDGLLEAVLDDITTELEWPEAQLQDGVESEPERIQRYVDAMFRFFVRSEEDWPAFARDLDHPSLQKRAAEYYETAARLFEATFRDLASDRVVAAAARAYVNYGPHNDLRAAGLNLEEAIEVVGSSLIELARQRRSLAEQPAQGEGRKV